MKRKSAQKPSQSLRTFYLYAVLVFAVIGVALFIKLVLIIQQSKFDGRHHFTITITKENKVKEIISFSPEAPSMSILKVTDKNIAYSTLGKNYGIASDAHLETNGAMEIANDVPSTMLDAMIRFPAIKTDATIFDLVRLNLLAQNIVSKNTVVREIALTEKNPENNTIIARALNDSTLSAENISIQIINASDVSGVGQRLGHVLTNMGANVVDVSTSHNTQATSKIQFYGEKSYTLDQIAHLLGYPVSELSRQPIANIVIILGKDSRDTNKF